MFDLPSKENACGLFNSAHIISSIICLCLVVILALLAKRLSDKGVLVLTRVMAIVLLVLEAIKITFKLTIGEGQYIDHWVPLFYCSLFIYALFMCGFGKGVIYKIGCTFLASGCVIAGLIFLAFPTTSLPDYPIYHFISMHSMLFHSSMVIFGLIYMQRGYIKLNRLSYLYYVIFVSVPLVLSLILNPIFDANLMMIDNPTNLPIGFILKIYEAVPFVYTLGACLLYLTVPYFLTKGALALYLLIKSKGNAKSI